MHTKEEVMEDLYRVRDLVNELETKYGPEFSCALSAGVGVHTEITSDDEPDAYAGVACVVGRTPMLHSACHALLESPKFVDEFFDAVKCVILRRDTPDFLKRMVVESIESMKRLLIMETKQFKEHEAEKETDEAIQDLLRQAGFTN